MAVYRRCTKCRTNLPAGQRTCSTHSKGTVVWGGVIDVGTRRKRRRKSIGYHLTKADAVAAEQELIKQWSNGMAVEDLDITVGDWLSQWWEGPARLKVRPTTHRSYRFLVDAITRHIGDVRLQDLSLARWQAFLAHLVADDGPHSLAASTARSYHAVMRRSLQVALSQGLIVRNVLADPEAFQLRLPSIDVAVWTPTQLGQYLDVAMTHRLGPALWMATFTGARRGEVVGMQWRDLDLEAGEWHIKRAMLITGEGTPKSKAGNRIIGLDDVTIGMLTKWHSQQREELLSVGINPTQHDRPCRVQQPGKGILSAPRHDEQTPRQNCETGRVAVDEDAWTAARPRHISDRLG